jgi:hypothetical protein
MGLRNHKKHPHNPQNSEANGGSEGLESSEHGSNPDFSITTRHRPGSIWDAADWQADYEERAGIIEFDGNLPRTTAEKMARPANIQSRHDPFQLKE